MTTMQIKKSITLEMAHRLPNHKGKCSHIHGHSWQLTVCVTGKVRETVGNSDDGMVVDFSILKDALKKIENVFDHSIMLCKSDPLLGVLTTPPNDKFTLQTSWWGSCADHVFGTINVIDAAPTSENMARLWGKILVIELEVANLAVLSVSVKETCTSEAECFLFLDGGPEEVIK